MLAGQITGPCQIELVEAPEPKLAGPGEIIFETELACLCGSDLLFYEADYPEFPVLLGHSLHEMIGTVKETSGQRFRPGDRVLVVPVNQVGFFERYNVSEERAVPFKPEPTEEEALLAQPLGTVIYSMRKLPPVIDQDVVVVGQGPIGQLFNATLRNLGARQIIGVDLLESRLQTSPKMGATAVVDASRVDPVEAVRELTGGAMADVVVEAVGHREQTVNLCIDLCRRESKLLLFGVPRHSVDVNLHFLWRKNIDLVTSVNPDFTRTFPLAMQWINEGRIDVSPIVTHRFPLHQIQQAFELFHRRQEGAQKVFIDFPAGIKRKGQW